MFKCDNISQEPTLQEFNKEWLAASSCRLCVGFFFSSIFSKIISFPNWESNPEKQLGGWATIIPDFVGSQNTSATRATIGGWYLLWRSHLIKQVAFQYTIDLRVFETAIEYRRHWFIHSADRPATLAASFVGCWEEVLGKKEKNPVC